MPRPCLPRIFAFPSAPKACTKELQPDKEEPRSGVMMAAVDFNQILIRGRNGGDADASRERRVSGLLLMLAFRGRSATRLGLRALQSVKSTATVAVSLRDEARGRRLQN